MKKLVLSIALALSAAVYAQNGAINLPSQALATGSVAVQNTTSVKMLAADIIVHITETGKCYHKSSCPATSGRATRTTTLTKALEAGLRACQRCH